MDAWKFIKKRIYAGAVIGAFGMTLFGGFGSGQPVSDWMPETVVHAAPAEEARDYPVCENWLDPVEITGEKSVSVAYRGAGYATKYDPRNVNGKVMVTPVKYQGAYNTCWAFALVAAAESNLIKNGYADAAVNLSENQFAYFFYNRKADAMGNTAGDANNCSLGIIMEYGSMAWAQNGGTLQGSGLALAGWTGLTTEEISKYISIPDASLCYQHDYSVRDVFFYSYDIRDYTGSVNRIKQAIMEHGAVASGINMVLSQDRQGNLIDNDYYNAETAAYYYNKEAGNHAIAIVGWDDSFSRNRFGKIKPTRNGAWIVKNSYSTEVGDEGYFYVSYEDASLDEMMALEMIPASLQYDNNYQYDGTAVPAVPKLKSMYGSQNLPNGTKYANVFKAKASSDYAEELKAVSVCTFSANTNYTVNIYTGLTKPGNPTSGTKAASASGTLTNAGYQTIQLPQSVALMPGEYFSVVIALSGTASEAEIGMEVTASAGWISFSAGGAAKQSFIYYEGKWEDYYAAVGGNLRIKAFTDMTAVKPSVQLSDSSLGISKGSSKKLSLKKKPANLYRKVISWKSSNSKVATVNSSGKVTGKSYGKATISAEVMKGAKKTTLKCKVTVGPPAVKNFKAVGGKKKITVKWKKNSAASGFTVYYSKDKNSGYKTLGTVGKGSATKYTKKKLSSGTYYVKMRPYVQQGKTKLYGGYTAAKKVTVK